MNKAKFLRLLTAIFAIATAILGFAHYAELLPPQYAVVVGLITSVMLATKEIVVIVGDIADDGQRNHSFKPDGKGFLALLFICGLSGLMIGCTTSQQQDALTFGKRVAISAADAAVMIAEIRLEEKRAELKAAIDAGAPLEQTVLKAAAFKAARDALDKARAALAAEAAKLDAKAPRDVMPGGQTSASAEVGKAGALPSMSSSLPRGLCLGTPASCEPSQPSCIACHAPQAGRLVLMRSVGPAALRTPHLPRDDTGNLAFPRYGGAVAAHLASASY